MFSVISLAGMPTLHLPSSPTLPPSGIAASAVVTPGGVEPQVSRNSGFLPGSAAPPGGGRNRGLEIRNSGKKRLFVLELPDHSALEPEVFGEPDCVTLIDGCRVKRDHVLRIDRIR